LLLPPKLMLENGRIVESGNYATLYDDDGVYAQMYRQQLWLGDLAERGVEPAMAARNGESREPKEVGSVIL